MVEGSLTSSGLKKPSINGLFAIPNSKTNLAAQSSRHWRKLRSGRRLSSRLDYGENCFVPASSPLIVTRITGVRYKLAGRPPHLVGSASDARLRSSSIQHGAENFLQSLFAHRQSTLQAPGTDHWSRVQVSRVALHKYFALQFPRIQPVDC